MRPLDLKSLVLIALVAGLQAPSFAAEPCNTCGVIASIQMTTQDEEWTPLGAVSAAPSLATSSGAEQNSAFSFSRDGKRGLVLVGAAGGAAYAKKPNSYKRPRWDVTVNMDGGGARTIQQRYEPYLKEGDRVRVMGTQLELVD